MLNTLDRVRIIVAGVLDNAMMDVDPSDIEPSTQLVEDLGADSLNIMEIVLDIEDEFDVDIEERETEKLHTVQDIVRLIELKKGA